jgi:hypothetical protein
VFIYRIPCYLVFFLWLFDPILGHGLPLRGFAITHIGHTTLGRTSLDEWSPAAETSTENTQPSQQTNFHDIDGIRTQNPKKRAGTDPRLRPCGRCNRRVQDLNVSPWCEKLMQVSGAFPNESYKNDNFN